MAAGHGSPEFALLTGISTKAFGDMRMFVQVLMEGRLNETLPQVLASCGYRTLMLFPMNNGFLRLDRFYRSIGFSEDFSIKTRRTHRPIASATGSIFRMRSMRWVAI